MYYLNDRHPDYQYAVYCKYQGGSPYIKTVLDNKEQLDQYIESIVNRHNQFHHIFYIDNDFYDNKYPKDLQGIYYKVLKRKVNDWEEVA